MKKAQIKNLKKIVKKDFSIIKSQYEKSFEKAEKSSNQIWLFDNFYVLEAEAKGVIKSLSYISKIPCDESKLPRLYSFLFRELADGKIKDIDSIVKKIYKNDYSVTEIELLELMMKSALISRAAQGVLEEGELLPNVIVAFSDIKDIDFEDIFKEISKTEKILCEDLVYKNSDNETKSTYRHILSKKAKEQKMSESEYALNLIEDAYLSSKSVVNYLKKENKSKKGYISIALEIAIPLAISVLLAVLINNYFLAIILYIPIWEITRAFILFFIMRTTKPLKIPKIDLENAKINSCDTLIVVSSLLPNAKNIEIVKNHLMSLYLSNKSEGIKVCLLADLKSATQKVLPEDEKNIKLAKKMIDELNEKKDVFSLLLRQRKYSKTQNEYTGYDRKRGAITELIRAIKGDKSGFIVMHGNISKLNSTKYIMALDADTELSFDAIKKLISAAIHPQNKPQIDYEKGIVKSGYAIFVPRVETDLKSAYETGFTRVMAGAGGIGHYSSACGERYQDLFGQSIFSGKGLIDVDAFYLLLNDRFKDETILSHDILEGEFLRTAFIGNAVVTDSFPENEISYFKRQSRWIRGDWQNLNFIFKKVNFKNGKKQNPLPFISKFKLFDNLRRSLLPTFSLILILVSAFLPYNAMLITSITGILSIAINEILAGVTDLFFTRGRGFYSIFYGDAIPNALKKLLEAIVNIVMLPKAAIVSINAVLKGIYRRFISHKNMLEWVTAAQSEHDNKNFSLIKNSFSSVVCFLILLIFGGHFHLFIGLFFLSNTLLLTLSAKKSKENTKDFTFLEREKLIEDAKKMWNYYEKYCNEKSNFLPPDNVQKEPIFRIAERTSPTNIGMMLCSCLAARDFLFISTEELYTIIKKSLDSIEKLEKWNGNLLNWYSTADLKPLNPIYVSTVDSGNFLCCLVALKQGLLEYANENPKLFDLINRVDGIIKSTNLKVLYNKNRRLFHIGYDLDKNELTNSYYDLLMSEARMTSYFAVSQRQVPSEHWAALSRMQARYKSYCGSVSWTGTMFEYFMPNLFIPSFKNSNTYESLKFCMLCQKNRTRKKHIPWGISESAFYKLDAQMNYQYKAHGVGKLALNRYVNSELVISPYSSYLCLEFDKKAAFNNIKHLKKLDVSSDCGLFEAIDFTSSRTQSRDFKAVQSYMAHHIGMSIIGILNAVKGDIMQKRFMRDENSMAAKSLLTESVINDKPLKNIDLKETPSRPKREDANKIVFENPTPTSPNVGVLSNGEWTTIVSDLGTGHSIYQLVNATRESREIIRQPMGIFAFVKTKSESIPLCKALDYKNKQSFKFKSLADRLILTTQGKTINSQTTVTVNARFPSEMREYKIKNNKKTAINGRLYIYFEPSLTTYKNETAHKAFSNIFLLSERMEKLNSVVIERRPRASEKAKYLACGFLDNTKFEAVLSREKALLRHEGIFSLLNIKTNISDKSGKLDTCVLMYTDFNLEAKEEKSFKFFLTGGISKEELADRIVKLRASKGAIPVAKSPFNSDDDCSEKAISILPKIFYGVPKSNTQQKALAENTADVRSLWSMGISGDNPIMLIKIITAMDILKIADFVKIHQKLRACGIFTDLVITYRAAIENEKSFEEKLMGIMKKASSVELFRCFGGVHLINNFNVSNENKIALVATSCFEMQIGQQVFCPLPIKYEPKNINIAPKPNQNSKNKVKNGAYEINKNSPLPWCYSLCNASFGTLIGDSTLGFTFAINSHDNKLSKWNNDTIYDNNGECIFIKIDDEIYDLIRSSNVKFGNNEAVYNAKIKGLSLSLTVSVPQKGMKKEVNLEITNKSEKNITAEISYYIEPVLGTDVSEQKYVKMHLDGDAIIMYSPWNYNIKGTARLSTDGGNIGFCNDKKDYFEGKWMNSQNLTNGNMAAITRKIIFPPKRKENVKFTLSFGRFESSAKKIEELNQSKMNYENKITIDTQDKELNDIFNYFLENQIINGRIYGRTGFYQCSGAYGFRDQLQDTLSLLITKPELAKWQILRCCAAQFKEGDVLHWWYSLPNNKRLKGVRTRYSDDLLWLCYALAKYVKTTGDIEILKKKIPFLSGDMLLDNENEKFFEAERSGEKVSVLEHAKRAVEKAIRLGEHSLVLIGGGDWNDGYNKVGIKGKGESVWLSQFAAMALSEMADVFEIIGDEQSKIEYLGKSQKLKQAVDECAWDSDHYIRAFYDDGTKMGSWSSNECKIDSLSQSFAVLSNMPNEDRKVEALLTAYKELVDEDAGIIKLFSPPFSGEDKRAGYVTDYPMGFRENGGQYTHAAVWLCLAFFEANMPTKGIELLNIINPLKKYTDDNMAKRYKTEPYYLCGDVYSAKGYEGRGGWSLYTGSAGWYYTAILEGLLGIKKIGNRLYLSPNLPPEWKGFNAELQIDGNLIDIQVENNEKSILSVDGKVADFVVLDGKNHSVIYRCE